MNNIYKTCLILILLFITFTGNIQSAETGILNLNNLYYSLLKSIESNDYEYVEEAIPYLEKMNNKIIEYHNIDLLLDYKDGLEKRENNKLIKNIKRFLYYEMYFNFERIINGDTLSPIQLKQWHKIAYRAYGLITQDVESNKITLELERKIEQSYQNGYALLRRQSPHTENSQGPNLIEYSIQANIVLKHCSEICPTLASLQQLFVNDKKK